LIDHFRIKMSSELPLEMYLDHSCDKITDFDICDFNRYASDDVYRDYFHHTDRKVLVKGKVEDNDESKGTYHEILKDFNNTYYMLPEGMEEEFYSSANQYCSRPIYTLKGNILSELSRDVQKALKIYKADTIFAVSSETPAFNNDNNTVGYMNEKDIPYASIRRAINRKIFLRNNQEVLKNTPLMLLGCESLVEFDDWHSEFDKSNIILLVSDQPLRCSLYEDTNYSNYEDGFCMDESGIKIPSEYAKFPDLPENWYTKTSKYIEGTRVKENFLKFRRRVHYWED
jgi:hypothetical protein